MRRSTVHRWLGLAVSASVLLGACSAAATPAPTAAPSAQPGTKTFSLVQTSPGLSSAPLLAAIDAMRGAGYKIDVSNLEAADLVIQGVAGGQFQFGLGGTNVILAAVEKGAKVQIVVSRNENEWTLYARKATIKTCADLSGKKLAIHSEASISTAMVKNYITTVCPGATPTYIIIAGSNNRVAALLADQIDASPLELNDAITIDAQASDRFGLLSNFVKDLPKLQTTGIVTNTAWAKDNPGTAIALVKALLTEYRRIAGNAAALQADAEKYVKDAIDPKTIAAATKRYTDLTMFPLNGALTKENLQYTADFFGPKGTKGTAVDIALDTWTNISYLESVLKEIGTK